MWVEKRANGKYKFVKEYKDYYTEETKRVSITLEKDTAAYRDLASRELDKLIEKRCAYVPSERLTLKELIEKYRDYQRMTVKASTYSRNYHACNSLMQLLGENTFLDKLNAAYIKEKFLQSGKSAGTLNEHRARLKALLNWGYENDYIADVSYMGKVKPFDATPHREKISDKFLEGQELKKLIDAMDDWRWKYATEFLALSGLRFGEFVALSLADVDVKEEVIHVTKTYDSQNKVVTPPKTSCSIRDVYMQAELLKVAKKIRLNIKYEQFEKGYHNSKHLFFPSKTDGYAQYYAYEKYLKATSKKAIGRQITAHTLRHTHASLLFEQGIDIDTISRRLGHENSKVTREIYLHTTEKLKERDKEKIRNVKIVM